MPLCLRGSGDPGGYSGFDVLGRCEWGHKLKPPKYLGLEAKPPKKSPRPK